MNPIYPLRDPSAVLSPGLLFYRELILHNLQRMLQIAGTADRLRPHVKTHKTREIARMEMNLGITKHKCATLAEAEMLAGVGAADVLLAYPLVGPNCERLAQLVQKFPGCRFSVTADHPVSLQALSDALSRHSQEVAVLLDMDTGQHRTGIAAGSEAVKLYEMIDRLPGLRPGGLQIYDGHNHQENLAERQAAVRGQLEPVLALRSQLEAKGLPVPRLVLGGTPTFPIYARLELPGAELSPGTCVLHDHGYGSHFPDITGFEPAALLLTRVISRPTPSRLTLDLGYKAMASDPPAGKRGILLNVPDYQAILQNEEHLVIETPAAEQFAPGDVVYAIPTHICPTCAMHRFAYVIDKNQVVDRWDILARDRMLTI
ncbi:MAG: D-TA family PLP-dependent enzyme [Gemmataceae bacterium]